MKPGEASIRRILAPISCDLEHPGTTDIVIQQPGKVGVLQDGKWLWRSVPELTFKELDALSLLAGTWLSKPFDPANPIVETTLPDGQRYTAIRPPITADGSISIAIRNPFRRLADASDGDLMALMQAPEADDVDQELLRLYHTQQLPAFFKLAVQSRKSIAAIGVPGSGKTTFIRKIMRHIAADDRVVTIEDTAEFGVLPTDNRVKMIYGAAGITAERCCETALRLIPDRVAIQELRGAEAYAFLRIRTAGYASLTTWHAEASDPFTPLALMIKGSERGRAIPDDKLDAMLRSIIDVIAVCHRHPITKKLTVPSVYFRLANDARTLPR